MSSIAVSSPLCGNSNSNRSTIIGNNSLPLPKPLDHSQDEEDALIVRLKTDGYTDKEVAQKLREQGFTNLHDRTVGSRWGRLRKVLEEEDDKYLDDNLSDWHAGEDDELGKSYSAIDKKIQEEIQKLEDKRWGQVSNDLAVRLRKKKYSGKACKERFGDLQKGSALLPIEYDGDQEGRRVLREERIKGAKLARAAEQTEAETARLAEINRERASKQARHNKLVEKANAIRQKEDEKKAKLRVKEERRLRQQQARDNKKAVLKRLRDDRDWTMERHRKEKEVYKRLTGKDLIAELKEAKDAMIEFLKSNGQAGADIFDDGFDPLAMSSWGEENDGGPDNLDDTVSHTTDDASSSGLPIIPHVTHSGIGPTAPPRKIASILKTKPTMTPNASRVRFRTPVTAATLLNARSILTDAELNSLLATRNLSARGRNETHAEVVARLATADWELVVPDLKDMLKALGEKTEGRKEEMIRRLQDADARDSFQGSMGVLSTDLDFMRSYGPYLGEFVEVLAAYEAEAKGLKDAEMGVQVGGDGGEAGEPEDGEEIEEEIRVAIPMERALSLPLLGSEKRVSESVMEPSSI